MSVDPVQSREPAADQESWQEAWAERAPGPLSHLPGPARIAIAAVFTVSGGLALIYFMFAALGAVDFSESRTATIIAIALLVVWVIGFVLRWRSDAARVQRADRERRGY